MARLLQSLEEPDDAQREGKKRADDGQINQVHSRPLHKALQNYSRSYTHSRPAVMAKAVNSTIMPM